MPNTIAHFAINGLFTRTVLRYSDFKWIYLACVIPDLPWIGQRIAKVLPFLIDLYDLRAYCVAQSSLLLCVFLCVAFSMFARQRSKVFIILVIGCLLHLLLDAVQIKWANGVQLLAPYDWSLFRLDLFWPESMGTYLLTAAGLLYFVFNIKKSIEPNCEEFKLSKVTLSLGLLFLFIWLALPLAFIQSNYTQDNHFIATLKDSQNRSGKSIEIDRNTYLQDNEAQKIKTSYGEIIDLKNVNDLEVSSGTLISLQGKFTDNHTIEVDNYHIHSRFRDYASMIGLACVLIIWLIFFARCSLSVVKPVK